MPHSQHKVLLPWKITLELFVQRTLFQHTRLRYMTVYYLLLHCVYNVFYLFITLFNEETVLA